MFCLQQAATCTFRYSLGAKCEGNKQCVSGACMLDCANAYVCR
jgi:hypothetical protein